MLLRHVVVAAFSFAIEPSKLSPSLIRLPPAAIHHTSDKYMSAAEEKFEFDVFEFIIQTLFFYIG